MAEVEGPKLPYELEFRWSVKDRPSSYSASGQRASSFVLPDGTERAVPPGRDGERQLVPGLRVRYAHATIGYLHSYTSTFVIESSAILPLQVRWDDVACFHSHDYSTYAQVQRRPGETVCRVDEAGVIRRQTCRGEG